MIGSSPYEAQIRGEQRGLANRLKSIRGSSIGMQRGLAVEVETHESLKSIRGEQKGLFVKVEARDRPESIRGTQRWPAVKVEAREKSK